MKKYQHHGLHTIKNITNRLIIEEVKNLQSPRMYRAGHNHGLMVDLALLNLIKFFPEYKNKINVDLVLQRSSNTLKEMWHPSGLTKEHSVSYQEYNIPLTADYFLLLQELELEAYTSIDLNSVLEESKRFLGYALKSNGEYFPLGDSFRLPNKKILNNIYGVSSEYLDNAHKLLSPCSNEDGFYTNDHFFIYRRDINGKKIHFAATCCWDSHNHKQNDELSFCLDVNGVTIFDDPGYTEFTDWDSMLNLKSESMHTTITIDDKAWGDVLYTNNKSKVIVNNVDCDGFNISMLMERYEGIQFIRNINFEKGVFEISDTAISKAQILSIRFNRAFIFGNNIDVVLKDDDHSVFYLYDKKSKKEIAKFYGVRFSHLNDINIVGSDRKEMKKSKRLIVNTHADFGQVLLEDGFIFNFPKLVVDI
ncbi:heparinase II/III domain-containing protein [Halomonas sp. AOP43-A1-21]